MARDVVSKETFLVVKITMIVSLLSRLKFTFRVISFGWLVCYYVLSVRAK